MGLGKGSSEKGRLVQTAGGLSGLLWLLFSDDLFLYLPVYRRYPVFLQIGIGAGEVFAAEETAIGGQRRGVRRAEDKMAAAVDKRAFFLRVAAPKHEDNMFSVLVDLVDHLVGKAFPAQCRMGMRLPRADGQDGIEQ